MSGEPYLHLNERNHTLWEASDPVPLAVIVPEDNLEVVVLRIRTSTRLLWLDTAKRLALALESFASYPGLNNLVLESDNVGVLRQARDGSEARLVMTVEELEPFQAGPDSALAIANALRSAVEHQSSALASRR